MKHIWVLSFCLFVWVWCCAVEGGGCAPGRWNCGCNRESCELQSNLIWETFLWTRFSKDLDFRPETAMSFNRAAQRVVLRRRRSFGQRAGRSCELALTCFLKTFPQKFSLSPPKLVISPPPSKPSQPFCLPAPTPTAAIHTQLSNQIAADISKMFLPPNLPHGQPFSEQESKLLSDSTWKP